MGNRWFKRAHLWISLEADEIRWWLGVAMICVAAFIDTIRAKYVSEEDTRDKCISEEEENGA